MNDRNRVDLMAPENQFKHKDKLLMDGSSGLSTFAALTSSFMRDTENKSTRMIVWIFRSLPKTTKWLICPK